MDDIPNNEKKRSFKPMHFAMMACCAFMLLPVVGYYLAGGSLSSLGSNFAVFAPLLLCAGAHLVMHKFMGKSCHGKKNQGEDAGEKELQVEPKLLEVRDYPSTIPQVARR